MELEFDKYCVVDGSPKTVLPAPYHRSKAVYRKSNEKVKCGKDLLGLDKNFRKISFNRYRSASCRDARPTRANPELHKRGSVYQGSEDVNLFRNTDFVVGRQKIELSRESAAAFPLGIIDSLCSLDEDGSLGDRERSSAVSTSEKSTSSYSINYCFLSNSKKVLLDNNISKPAKDIVIKSVVSSFAPVKYGNSPREKKPAVNLRKSLSSKLALPHSPARSENDCSETNGQKNFDRSVKSEDKNEPMCKLAMKDFSDNLNLVPPSSPAHIRGFLKSEHKNGLPFFEFSVSSPPDDACFVAKTRKVNNALTWVYTFHSLHHKRKSNASLSSMVGQMVVSCNLRTELNGPGAFNDAMVQECVLYDVPQSRTDITKLPLPAKKMVKDRIFKHYQPLAAPDMHPELEIAAIVMRVPFVKRESLKFKTGDGKKDCLLELCQMEEKREEKEEGISVNSCRGEMHVVVPAGSHSLPCGGENRGGPSPLLDRWRLGGGCDCNGWDMACPLDVFVNPDFRICDGQPLVDRWHPVELFVQGRKKNKMPAFTMRAVEDGKYVIHFHAQLSSLQAFSICVAILHAANASTADEHEANKRMLQSGDSLRVFAEEEIKNLMDSISEEEKFKAGSKKDEVLPSFVLNPPFSPIARV
ncbi:Protein of unknown function (DUF3527 [Striga hermonthica]|uniref:DUF3527 domain protein n=1 Tax=Striga hermonthica TaxID=68872 RepID=A0A9N7MV93_STRHE|nr:Protein of unknown function (DUF3527 [Striga hermonthica]